jgi:hypothetical protein
MCERGRMEEGQVGEKQANSERNEQIHHETVRKDAKTSKYVFLLLRARGMYVQLVPTFKICSWKPHTQYNCDNGFTHIFLPQKGNFMVTDCFFPHYISLGKNDLSTSV